MNYVTCVMHLAELQTQQVFLLALAETIKLVMVIFSASARLLPATDNVSSRPNDFVSEQYTSAIAAVPCANRADQSDLTSNLPYQHAPAPTIVSHLLDIPSTQNEKVRAQNEEVELRKCSLSLFYN